jgi:hypothetical protein
MRQSAQSADLAAISAALGRFYPPLRCRLFALTRIASRFSKRKP